MNYIKHLRGFYQRIETDEKISPHHISLYMALFQFWNIQRFRKQIDINRQDLMSMSRIGSTHTYARCMKQLNDWGYIEYLPSSNRYSGGKVSCIRFDTTNDTTNDLAKNTANDIATDTTNGTLLINNTNNTNNKPVISNFFNNGRRKKVNGSSPYHVVNDKDYSEPL